MNDKRKNADYSGLESTFNPIAYFYGRRKHYQFYVDATPYGVIMHLHELEKTSTPSVTYRVTTSGVETGYTFEIERHVNKLNSHSRTVVTGEVTSHDPQTKGAVVIVRVTLIDSVLAALMMFLGTAAIFLTLITSVLSGFSGFLLGLISFPVLTLVPTIFFVPARRKALNIVAKHLATLRKAHA